jgi:hypothetical protein
MRGIFGFTSGRYLTIGLSLPLAEISTTDTLVSAGPLRGTRELPALCYSISLRDFLEGESLFFLGPEDPFLFCRYPFWSHE